MHPVDTRERAQTLVEQGLNLSEIGRRLGVARATVRVWRDSSGRQRGTDCFICSDDSVMSAPAAYAALLGYYLGDGHLTRAQRYSTLRVTCDRSYPWVIADVQASVLGVRPSARLFVVAHGPGAVSVTSHWQHWECVLPQHGPGHKSTRLIQLLPWQQAAVDAAPASFLRGLFFSDGSRFTNRTSRTVRGETKCYEYPRWQLTNTSADIIDLCTGTLDSLLIPWRRSSAVKVSVSRRAAVARLDALIGMKTGQGAHRGPQQFSRQP